MYGLDHLNRADEPDESDSLFSDPLWEVYLTDTDGSKRITPGPLGVNSRLRAARRRCSPKPSDRGHHKSEKKAQTAIQSRLALYAFDPSISSAVNGCERVLRARCPGLRNLRYVGVLGWIAACELAKRRTRKRPSLRSIIQSDLQFLTWKFVSVVPVTPLA